MYSAILEHVRGIPDEMPGEHRLEFECALFGVGN